MKVSVTGATGFIGSHLVDALLARGDEVTALVRRTSNLRWLEGKPVRLLETDLTDVEELRMFVEGRDVIYHIAGVVKSKSAEGYYRANVESTRNLLEACGRYNPDVGRFVHVSSQTVVGPSPDLEHPVDEQTPCAPITTYAKSKLAAEEVARSFASSFPVTIVRPPAVYGPRDTEIFIFFQTISKGLNPLIGFDEKKLSLIHVSDLVQGFLLAGDSSKSVGETYFISSEVFYGWKESGDLAAHLMGKRNPIGIRIPHVVVYIVAGIAQFASLFRRQAATLNIEKARDLTQRYWICDAAKAARDLGFRQEISLEEGFRNTIQWYREEGWLA